MAGFPYCVRFLNERGDRVEKTFSSLYKCRVFVLRCKHSNRVTLISYPVEIDE